MEPKHVITQVVGTVAALGLAHWGWKEFRRDWHDHHRLPLTTGPSMGGRTVLVALGGVAAVLGIALAALKLELIPKARPDLLIAMMAWLSISFVFALLGSTTILARRSANGWLTLVEDDTLRIDADGASVMLKLRPGAVTLRAVDGAPQYVQLDATDGVHRAHVWGMVGFRELALLTRGEVAPAQGLMVATSMSPLCRRLAPYFAKT